jgi:methylglyoxal/glyoxal reductase
VHGEMMKHPPLLEIARKYNATAAQVLIRWGLQQGYVLIPKTDTKVRIPENRNVWYFELEEEDMKTLDAMNEDYRIEYTVWDSD